MTWSCIAAKKPSFRLTDPFDIYSYGCRPCKAFWDQCLLALLLYSSSVASLFSFARNKSSGVYLTSVLLLQHE